MPYHSFHIHKKEKDPFLVEKHNIGFLTDSTQVKDLESVFQNDSIVKFVGGDEFTGNINNIDIYDKAGNHLLALTPMKRLIRLLLLIISESWIHAIKQ